MTLTIGIKYQIETSILAGYYDDETLEHKHQSIKEKKRKRKKKESKFHSHSLRFGLILIRYKTFQTNQFGS